MISTEHWTSYSCEQRNFTTELVESAQALEAVIPDWLAMVAQGVSGHTIHNDPRLILNRLRIDPSIRLRIVLVRSNQRLVAVVPFYIHDWDFRIQFSIWKIPVRKANVLRLFGDTAIWSSSTEVGVCVRGTAGFLCDRRQEFDYMEVRALDSKSEFWIAAFGEGCPFGLASVRPFVMREDVIHRVMIAHDFKDYVGQLGKKSWKSIRQSMRKLADRGAALEVYTSAKDVPALLQCMREIYGDAWQARAIQGVVSFGTDRMQYVEGVAEQGWLRSYVLRIDGRPVAFDHGYLHDGVYHNMEGAYRQDSKKWGPGTVLAVRLIEDLHQTGLARMIDYGAGDLPYKRTLGNCTVPIRTVCFAKDLRWSLTLRLQIITSIAYRYLRQGFSRLGVEDWIRRVIKKKD